MTEKRAKDAIERSKIKEPVGLLTIKSLQLTLPMGSLQHSAFLPPGIFLILKVMFMTKH